MEARVRLPSCQVLGGPGQEGRVRLPSCQDLQTEANINQLLYPLLADSEPSSSSGLITSPSNAYQQTPSKHDNAGFDCSLISRDHAH